MDGASPHSAARVFNRFESGLHKFDGERFKRRYIEAIVGY